MPKIAQELNESEVQAKASQPGFHPVGGVAGLALTVAPTGARSWVLRFTWGTRRRDLGLGSYPTVTLASARQRAREAREKIAKGIDPAGERKARREALLAEQAKEITFEQAARQCHRVRVEDFSNAKHRKDWLSSLERLAFPAIGKHRVCDVTNMDVLRVLEPVWKSTPETATRLRQRIESVMSWSTVAGYREGPNPARWDGNLKELLPKPKRQRTHYAALHFEDFPAFIGELRKMPGTAARALEFIALTAARSGEARLARWSEIDLKARVWRVPAARMKARKPHAVPLSDAAVALLEALPRLQGNPHIFASPRGGAYSDMSLLAVLRRMEVEIVPHGFRSTFKEWARNLRTAENVPRYADEVSELALAHVNSDATRAAYARDGLLDQRRDMMAEWGKFITGASK